MKAQIIVTTKGAIFEGKAPSIVNEELTAAMYEATALLEREWKLRAPVGVFGAAGGYLASIHGEVVTKGVPVVRGVVATQSPYGEVIEKGRTPGKPMPPAGSLTRWMEKILGMDEAQATRMEFVLRRKIGAKGVPARHTAAEALKAAEPALQAIFDARGFTIAARLTNE